MGQAKGEMKDEMFPKSLLNCRESRRMRGTLIAAATMTVLVGLSACSTYDSVTQSFAQHITPYRITVVQGNFVSAEAAAQMQVGMSRDQVKTLLGTPLLADMFHADRWDYIFYFKRGSTSVVQQRDFVVTFTGDRVASWTGGENLPSNLELLAEIDGDKGRKLPAAPLPAVPGASSGVAAAGAAGAATTVSAPAGQPSTQPDASSAFAGDANQQAAQAANRATAAVEAPTGRTRSSAMPNVPGNPSLPPNVSAAGNSQIQLQRRPQTVTIPNSAAVGPAGTSPTPANADGQATFYVPSTKTN
jgi:outer membrane protein assembly factor BamE